MEVSMNGVTNGAGPPPSTLAAQIVDNIQHQRPRRERAERNTSTATDDLQNLLDEFLKAGPGAFAGTDLPTRYQLVDVLLKACVQNLDAIGPFDDVVAVNRQSVQVLEVVESTISQSADLLLFQTDAVSSDGSLSSPFFLSLLPRLFTFLGNRYDESISEAGGKAIRACLRSESKGNFLRGSIRPVRQLIQDTRREIVQYLLGRHMLAVPPFPSDRTIKKVCPSAIPQTVSRTRVLEPRLSSLALIAARLFPPCLPLHTSVDKPSRADAALVNDAATLATILCDHRHSKTSRDNFAQAYLILFSITRFWVTASTKTLYGQKCVEQAVSAACVVLRKLFDDSSSVISDQICSAACKVLCLLLKHACNDGAIAEQFAATLEILLDNPGDWNHVPLDLQLTFVLTSSIILERELGSPKSYLEQLSDRTLAEELEQAVCTASGELTLGASNDRPRKRLRLSEPSEQSDQVSSTAKLAALMSDLRIPDWGVENVPSDLWKRMQFRNEEEQVQLLKLMSKASCYNTAAGEALPCPKCDTGTFAGTLNKSPDQSYFDFLFVLLTRMTTVQADQKASELVVKTPLPRVHALVVLDRLLSHSSNPEHLSLHETPIGKWCQQSLSSKTREVRMMAAKVLRRYVSFDADKEVSRRNRFQALDSLRQLSEKGSVQEHETVIWALGHLAELDIGHDEMNIILLRLVDYLGHPSPLVSGLAYDELLRLSNHDLANAKKLLEPYWSTIAVKVVGDLTTKPSAIQRLCEILGVAVNIFISDSRAHTIPYLVLTKKRDVLERIAAATLQADKVTTSSVYQLCLSNEQLPSLLARILMEPTQDPANLIQALLGHVSEDFNNMDVLDLLKIDQAAVASEIFQRTGELGDTQLAQARSAIEFLAEHAQNNSTSSARRTRRSDATVNLHTFFETHSLAITKSLSDVVTEVDRSQTLPDRRRCLVGMRQMITIGEDSVSGATPQLSACLRSTIANPDLCDDGFAAWAIMIKVLDNFETLIEPTFALIERHWGLFSPVTQRIVQELISELFANYGETMRDLITTLPSLGDIDVLSKYEADIAKFKSQLDQKHSLGNFADRLLSEDPTVILRTLEELEIYLVTKNAAFIQQSSQSEQPEPVIGRLLQVLLDTCVRYSHIDRAIAEHCARSLGLIGCLDTSRIEMQRENRGIVVLSNFVDRIETVDFIIFFLEEVIVPSFLSNMNTRSQNFLGYAMQELLQICDFKFPSTMRGVEDTEAYRKFMSISDETRIALKPFMTSKFTLKEGPQGLDKKYPIFKAEKSHGEWLQELVFDLMRKAQGDNASLVFSICKRIIRGQDITIASFLLPYIVLNVFIGEEVVPRADIGTEFLSILECSLHDKPSKARENIILCSQDMFRTLDYMTAWSHRKREHLARHRLSQPERQEAEYHIQVVQTIMDSMAPEAMANRAVECRNYSRALFYWEQHIRQWEAQKEEQGGAEPQSSDHLYEKLQEIYVSIDEPDGIEGASASLQLFNINQQVMQHRKAGNWTTVQNWSEMQLAEDPTNEQVQMTLLNSIREAGQHDVLLNQIAGMNLLETAPAQCKPFAIEACWETANWEKLKTFVPKDYPEGGGGFTTGIGSSLQALYEDNYDSFDKTVQNLRVELARGLSKSSVSSLQSCHQTMLQLHALTEIEAITDVHSIAEERTDALMSDLDFRLKAIGASSSDKQYVLGLRRAAMLLSKVDFSNMDISASWLQSSRLFRKQGSMPQAFRAVMHASQLDDQTTMIENARLMWKEGDQRKAIQTLEGAISAHAFEKHAQHASFNDSIARTADPSKQQNILEAKARLLLAKWTDQAGQTNSNQIITMYQEACGHHTRWEKGQYWLGKHYDKLLQSEKSMPSNKINQTVLTGELAKHVIENYVRAMAWGAKYVYETLPRCLTLWCEMGAVVDLPPESRFGTDEVFRQHIARNRRKIFDMTHAQMKKYIDRLPAWVFYTAFNQVCSRICHTNAKVYNTLADIVTKVCVTHPQQSLWALLAMVRSTQKDRMVRGQQCIAKVQEHARKSKLDGSASEIKLYITQGTRCTEQLLELCNADLKKFNKKQNVVSLKELGFSHKVASPCKLVVPIQANLALSLPAVTDGASTRSHKAFSKDVITISTFLDNVTLMSSLQRPRKVDMRGSDGKTYAVLCKPKDDLRLDQRLLEFNAMIQRLLKKDAESSKRRLYVKTYAVTPLNEECGLIEWVHGLKTHRDVLLKLYQNHGVSPDYREIQQLLNEAVRDNKPDKFTDDVLGIFEPVFHEWFVNTFPDPEAWYIARMRYTRSTAVMSMLGHTLGLGDRHSENIMIEEGNGGVMHVDFNCLFDKGQTFEKPEKVPFRLTHNMTDAFGAYEYEGPFRKACELTMGILRDNEDTLMTILEQFLHDPTIDLMGSRKKKHNVDVPNTPEGVLESVRNKLRGLLPKESVPLSVNGYVEHLIQQAVDPMNLASMYIGWCAFL